MIYIPILASRTFYDHDSVLIRAFCELVGRAFTTFRDGTGECENFGSIGSVKENEHSISIFVSRPLSENAKAVDLHVGL